MRKVRPLIPKGFTLIELIITASIFALIGVSAITGLVKTQDQFAFRNNVKGSANIIRELRSFAMGNKTLEVGGIPYQYGAHIDVATRKITIFGDKKDPGNKNEFDLLSDEIFDSYQMSNRYEYKIFDGPTEKPEITSITFFYAPTNANFHTVSTPLITDRFVAIGIYDNEKEGRSSFIVLFEMSGNPETFDSLADITN